MTGYTIAQASHKTGLSAYTLRYYEDIGLLEPVERAANGHRRYSDDDLGRISFLLKLRNTGMSLDDMLQFVQLYREGDESAELRHAMLSEHRKRVQAQMQSLQETLDYIDYKLAMYADQQESCLLKRQAEREQAAQ
ncbi:MAG: MerR family transcriptional regulator [Chloroflexota bacterium]